KPDSLHPSHPCLLPEIPAAKCCMSACSTSLYARRMGYGWGSPRGVVLSGFYAVQSGDLQQSGEIAATDESFDFRAELRAAQGLQREIGIACRRVGAEDDALRPNLPNSVRDETRLIGGDGRAKVDIRIVLRGEDRGAPVIAITHMVHDDRHIRIAVGECA